MLQALLFPVLLLYFLTRCLRNRRYWGTAKQRLGFLPREYQQTQSGAIWFHAVSVGEILAIQPLVRRVKRQMPGAPVFLSSTTLTGYAAAREKLSREVAGVFFAPVDYAGAVRRVLRRVRPSVLVVAETEIWPNLYRETRCTGAAVVLVNGRISDRALPSYVRWRWFFQAAFRQANMILTQSEAMRQRFLLAGAPPEAVQVGGNLKFDVEVAPAADESPVALFLQGAKVWIAASTSSNGALDEEDAVIAAFRKLAGWKLVLAPRKPERFREVARKLERAGLAFVARTELREGASGDVLLLDTLGELAGLFRLADAVFVGGTLAERGGHNILEPAWFGKSITVGPHMENFREIAEEFRAAGAIHEILSASGLEPFVDEAMGERARACALRNGGATERAFARIRELHDQALPRPWRRLPVRLALKPLTKAWQWGGRRRRTRGLGAQAKLRLPVISVGNITVGGTGKTPAVLHLARWLAREGRNPGVLTRGHGRASPHGTLAVPRGGTASRSNTGDEAQILLRSGMVALGVGADRAAAGGELERQGLADVLILDDGFQHVRLARDFDLVLIDALAPFGGFELMPLGRLREPLGELRRASAFLITRADQGINTAPIEAKLKQFNPEAPVFRSRVVPEEWVSLDGTERFAPGSLPYARLVAFCGLGNPQSFWRTLRALGIHPMECLEYGDHHLYTPREVRRFGQLGRTLGVEALLTTEKDVMNLCELTLEAIRPIRLFSLRIAIEIEREQELFALIREKLGLVADFAREERVELIDGAGGLAAGGDLEKGPGKV